MADTPTNLGYRDLGFRGGGGVSLNDLTDVLIVPDPPLVDGEFLIYDLASQLWKNSSTIPGAPSIGQLVDVTISPDPPVVDGQFLVFNLGTLDWENESPNLDALFDVTYTPAPSLGDKLKYSGVAWAPQADLLGNVEDVDLTGLTADDGLRWDGADFVPVELLYPLTVTAPATGEQLQWNGALWWNFVPDLELHADVESPIVKVDGSILRWNSGAAEWQVSTAPTNYEVSRRDSVQTGVISGGVCTKAVDLISVDVTAGTGVIVDSFTDPNNPVVTEVSWGAQNVPIPSIASRRNSWIVADSTGTLVVFTTRPTNVEWRDNINLCVMGHDVALVQLVDVLTSLAPSNGSDGQLQDLIRRNVEIIGGAVVPGTISTLELDQNPGLIFSPGINWHNDHKSPDQLFLGGISPIEYNYVTGDHTAGAANQTAVLATLYNPGGGATISAVPAPPNNTTIQRLYVYFGGTQEMLYGQFLYSNISDALSNFETDEALTIVPAELQAAIFRAWIVIRRGATDIQDTDDAVVITADVSPEVVGAIAASLYQTRTFPTPATLQFDDNVTYNEHTQVAQIDITVVSLGNTNGQFQLVKIIGDGVNDITFGADYIDVITGASQATINYAGDIYFLFQYNEALDIVHVWQSTKTDFSPDEIFLLTGRAGGQDAAGGTASGNNLTLRSTVNATKGQVRIRDTVLIGDTLESDLIGLALEVETQAGFQKGLVAADLNAAGRVEMSRFNGTYAAPTQALIGTELGEAVFTGYNNVGGLGEGARIYAAVTSSWVAGSTPADLVFATNPGAGLITRMTIEDTGDIIMSDGLGWGGGGILPTSDITLTSPLEEFLSFFNGTFEETFNAVVTEAGGVVTMSIEQSGTGDLTMRFSSGLSILDCTPPDTIILTAGTDVIPQPNWIYVLESTGVLTKSLTSWPGVEHIKVGYFLVPSAAFVASDGCYVVQNWNDHATGTDGQGHQSHMGDRIRLAGAQWFSGFDPAGVDDYLTIVGTTVDLKITSGIVWQMHEHISTAFDTSIGDVVLVKNWFGDAYHNTTNLFDIVQDSTGGTLNNRWWSFVVWGVGNKTGEYDPVIINLPSGSYTSQSGAENDLSGYTDFRIPRQFIIDSSTGFYIARIVVRTTPSTWAYGSYVDLRGLTPGATAAGGGAGGADTFSDGVFRIFNTTDPTKIMAFDAAGITTLTTRTLTIPDADGTIQLEGTVALDDLSNVTDTSAAAGWFLRSSAAATWVTQLGITEADITDLGAYLTATAADLLYGQLAAANSWAAVNTFDDAVELGIVGTLDVTGALAYFASTGSIELMIDDNNTGTAFFFRIATDGVPTGGTELFRIDDDGSSWLSSLGVGTSFAAPDLQLIGGPVPKIEGDATIQYEVPTSSDHWFTVNGGGSMLVGAAGNVRFGPSGTQDLRIYEVAAGDWRIEAQSTNDLSLASGDWINTYAAAGTFFHSDDVAGIFRFYNNNAGRTQGGGDLLGEFSDSGLAWGGGSAKSSSDLVGDAVTIQGDDVFASIAPTDGQVLTWDNGNSRWDAADAGGGGLTSLATILTPANYGGSSTVSSTGSVTLTETGYYRFDAYIRLFSTVPFRFRLRYTGSASGYMFKGSNADSDGQMSQSAIEGTGYMTYTNQGAARAVWLSGYVDITALNLGAQLHLELGATSTTGNTTTYVGSWMMITRVAAT